MNGQSTGRPPAVGPGAGSHPPRLEDIRPLWEVEKQAIEEAIVACEGNIPRAAAMLRVSPSTLYRKKQAWEQAAS